MSTLVGSHFCFITYLFSYKSKKYLNVNAFHDCPLTLPRSILGLRYVQGLKDKQPADRLTNHSNLLTYFVVVALLFYVHGKHQGHVGTVS